MHSVNYIGYSLLGTFWVFANEHLIVVLRIHAQGTYETVQRNFANTVTLVTGQKIPDYGSDSVSGNIVYTVTYIEHI